MIIQKRRDICYITGTRADYGLMSSTLRAIASDARLSLSVLVTGMHLSEKFGETWSEIVADGLTIHSKISVPVETSSGSSMARSIGIMLQGFVEAFEMKRPDVVLLLGDRGEMLAGALAAIHLNIPVVHIHGGERSGTVDEPVRHAISKLSHWHCVATQESEERLVRMGEKPEQITVTGAPGLDGLTSLVHFDKTSLCRRVGFNPAKKIGLLVFHPVLQEAHESRQQALAIVHALANENVQVLALMPNSDAGSDAVREVLSEAEASSDMVQLRTHLPRPEFVSWMAACDLMIGNSSSGIIEAATFGTPVINIGVRQNLRERNENVTDVAHDSNALSSAIRSALEKGRFQANNRYGDGKAGARIVELLARLTISSDVMLKSNAY